MLGNLGNIGWSNNGLKCPINFVPWKIGNKIGLRVGSLYSVKNEEEAKDYLNQMFTLQKDSSLKLLNIKRLDDEKWYYSFLYSYENRDNNVKYEDTYLFFKEDVVNFKEKRINLDKVKKDEIQTIFNTFYYANHTNFEGYTIKNSTMGETNDEYCYTIYYDILIKGDWNISDTLRHYSQEITINKNTGYFFMKPEKEIE